MNSTDHHTIHNNRGSAMVMMLLLVTALSLTAFMAADISQDNSKLMRIHRSYRELLYNSETGISVASQNHLTGWLQSTSNLFNLDDGDADVLDQTVEVNDENGDVMNLAQYSVARIEDFENDTDVDNLLAGDALTRDFYSLPHIAPPSVGSGSSPKNFEMRRYGILSTAIDRRDDLTSMTIQSGLTKLFNK